MTVTVVGIAGWRGYCVEVLEHTRMPYRVVAPAELETELARTTVLVTPHPIADGFVWRWLRSGGVAVACAGPGTVPEGRVTVAAVEQWPEPPDMPLRAFGGIRLPVTETDTVLARWADDGAAAITCRPVGAGAVVTFGADLWQSIVRIQQGWPVHRDAIPPPDGTAPVDDGVLKADDGIALSYVDDRALPPGAPPLPPDFRHEYPPCNPAPIFHRPHADLWRDLFLHCLWWAAERRGRPLPWLFYWPAGIPAVGHISHDSDGNRDADAAAALDAFAAADVPVTWCHLPPGGYSPATLAGIGAAGHEHALHYDALSGTGTARWGAEFLAAQHAWAGRLTGSAIHTNKNHYTRWEGWDEFYVWCARAGLRLDQSRGPSKQGNVGFPFGTCHLARPATSAGELVDLLTMPLHTQDLWFFAHPAVRDVILDQTLARHGVAHFLFHGANLNGRPPARQAVLDLAKAGRARAMPWWTAARIASWERARRGVDLIVTDDRRLRITARTALSGAALLFPVPGHVQPSQVDGDLVTRHGRAFAQATLDLPPGDTAIALPMTYPGSVTS